MNSIVEAKTTLNEITLTYNGRLPVNTEVIYLVSDNGDVVFYKIGGNELTSSLKEKLMKKWNDLGKPLAMTVRNNIKLERARVLNAMFDNNANTDAVQICVDALKTQAHIDTDENELCSVISGMHAQGYGEHISINSTGYELIYSKSADMYDGRLPFQLIDLIPIAFFNLGDTGSIQGMEAKTEHEEPAPENETFDFTDEALKEMKELGGIA